jgi:hypothetical protein
VTPAKVAPSTIRRFRGQRGPAGAQGQQGQPGQPGSPGAPGSARAYGRVEPTNVGQNATVTRSKGVVRVENPQNGTLCLVLDPSIDTSQTGVSVTPDLTGGATSFNGGNQPQTIAEWKSDPDPLDCATPGAFVVQTGRRSDSTGAGGVDTNTPENHPFFFVVP